jgi:hypothetical protein
MDDRITNKSAFIVYAWINLFLTISAIIFFMFFIIENILNRKIQIHNSESYDSILILIVISYMILKIIEFLIRPSYFEAIVSFGQIDIRSFNPNKRNGFRFFFMLFYRNHLTVHTIERQSYNNYRILIERSGIKKSLILQKTENGNLYESSPINISFLGVRKYTDLILAIDRLKEKFSLN